MFCKNCGTEIDDKAFVCPHCGVKVEEDKPAASSSGAKVGWGILSWFIPLVGLILFCVWRNDRHDVAKVCGICALVSFILNILVSVLYYVIIIAAISTIAL